MKFKSKRRIIELKNFIIKLIQIIVGSAITALSIDIFLLPNQLSTGGFSGIGTIGYYLLNIPVGTIVLVLNVPLFIVSIWRNGKKFFIGAILGTISLSYFLNLFEGIATPTTDRLLACIYGGILSGLGAAITLRAGASTGGTDLLAQIVKSFKPTTKTGSLIVLFYIIIIFLNLLFFKEIEIVLYSAIAIYILGKVLDIFFEGIDFSKMIIIISSKHEQISDRINKEVGRGTTAIYGMGMYKRQNQNLLLCVVSRGEVREIRAIINEIDKNAFIIITNAREVFGKGFKESF